MGTVKLALQIVTAKVEAWPTKERYKIAGNINFFIGFWFELFRIVELVKAIRGVINNSSGVLRLYHLGTLRYQSSRETICIHLCP